MDDNSVLVRLEEMIVSEIRYVLENDSLEVSADTALLGKASIMKSRELVELLLAIEDAMENEFSIEFDWTSDSAMSESRSILRSVGILRDHLTGLVKSG